MKCPAGTVSMYKNNLCVRIIGFVSRVSTKK